MDEYLGAIPVKKNIFSNIRYTAEYKVQTVENLSLIPGSCKGNRIQDSLQKWACGHPPTKSASRKQCLSAK